MQIQVVLDITLTGDLSADLYSKSFFLCLSLIQVVLALTLVAAVSAELSCEDCSMIGGHISHAMTSPGNNQIQILDLLLCNKRYFQLIHI